jgi:hypothetical protein
MTCGVLVSLQSDEEKLLLLFITPQDLMTSTLISLSLSLFRKALPKKSANRRKELVAQLLPLLLLLEEACF